MDKKYEVINDRFSQDSWVGTFNEIVDGVISCNQSWGTEYIKEDFRVAGDKIMVEEGHPYGESVLAVEFIS